MLLPEDLNPTQTFRPSSVKSKVKVFEAGKHTAEMERGNKATGGSSGVHGASRAAEGQPAPQPCPPAGEGAALSQERGHSRKEEEEVKQQTCVFGSRPPRAGPAVHLTHG